MSKPLEQWVEDACPMLGRAIEVHIENWGDTLTAEQREALWRGIMHSVRFKFGED